MPERLHRFPRQRGRAQLPQVSSEIVPTPRQPVLRLIALYKFAKATVLLCVALGIMGLLDPAIASRAQHWAAAVAASTDIRLIQRLLASAATVRLGQLETLGAAALFYATLFAVEGVGLWRERRWAAYLTLIGTAAFIPVEIYELLQRLTLLRVGVLLLNLAVVAYLARLLHPSSTSDPTGRSP